MAIVPIVHVTLIGQARSKNDVMSALQEKGYLHIIGSRDSSRDGIRHGPSTALEAYVYLKSSPIKRKQSTEEALFDQQKTVDDIITIKEQAFILQEEIDYLKQRIKNLEPWGDFNFPPVTDTGGYRFWFYIFPHYHLHDLETIDYPWECVHKDNRDAYIVVISREEPEGMVVARTHTGSKSLSEARERLDELESELEDLLWRRTSLTRWLTIFAGKLASAEDRDLLDRVANDLYDDGTLFYFEAWMPERHIEDLHNYTREMKLLIRIREPRRDENPPTLLENSPNWDGGESLVTFYTTPAYDMWDPSRPILLSFVMFFSMIISDAGYGFLLGLGWLLHRKNLSAFSAGFSRMCGAMVVSTIIYGIMVGSYFGYGPASGTLAGSLKLLDINNQDQMMFLSVCIGILHLITANSGNFLFARRSPLYLEHLGWIIILIGGFLWWLGTEIEPATDLLRAGGKILLIIGTLFVLFFSSLKPLNSWKNFQLRLLDGIVALTGFSRVFGDVLSYLRIFALGLASAQMAMTFNHLADEAQNNLAGLGTLAGISILLIGHGLNLMLAVMSGVVHGLRLNYIEFFNWGLSDEGYPFRPFRKRRITLWNQL